MPMAFGMLAGILAAQRTGKGQVIDCAMVEGAALIHAMMWALRAQGSWSDERGTNLNDSGAPFYDVYQCADGGIISIASIEPQFWSELLARLQLTDDADFAAQHDRRRWPTMKARLAAIFATRPRAHWIELMEGSDICFAPVLSMADAPESPHNAARGTFAEVDGVTQPMLEIAPSSRSNLTEALPSAVASGRTPSSALCLAGPSGVSISSGTISWSNAPRACAAAARLCDSSAQFLHIRIIVWNMSMSV